MNCSGKGWRTSDCRIPFRPTVGSTGTGFHCWAEAKPDAIMSTAAKQELIILFFIKLCLRNELIFPPTGAGTEMALARAAAFRAQISRNHSPCGRSPSLSCADHRRKDSGVLRSCVGGTRTLLPAGPFARRPLGIAAFPESAQRISSQFPALAPLAENRTNIRFKSVFQAILRVNQTLIVASFLQGRMVDQSSFGIKLLGRHDGLNHGFNLVLQVVALIHHVGDIRPPSRFPLVVANLCEDAEYLIGVDRSQGQVVVGIAAVVEMKSTQHVFAE